MKNCITLTFLFLISVVTSAQTAPSAANGSSNPAGDSVIQTTSATNGKPVIINLEMIQRFRDVKNDDGIYSWSQLLIVCKGQPLNEIMATLQEKVREYAAEEQRISEEEYYAYIRRIKQEINLKLQSAGSVALK
jgi:hypothetical protein